MSGNILFNKINKTGIITLNRPKALNSLNLEMILNLKDKLNLWEKDNNIKSVIIKGIGRAFCAGGDIKSVSLSSKNSRLRSEFFKNEYELNYYIKSFSKPYLSIWNGFVMGGGVGVSVYGNYRIATENTKFAMPESAIGFFPDVGTSYILSRMNNFIGLYLSLTGYSLNYFEVYKLGLANHFVKEKNINKIEKCFIKFGKIEKGIEDKLPKRKSSLIDNQKIINTIFSSMNINSIIEKLKTKKNYFTKKVIKHLLTRCPTSLALTCEIFKRAKKMSFAECLEMDYYFSQIMIKRNDFKNGVNEVLINKTHNQKWSPDTLEKIDNIINKYFNNMSTKKTKLDIYN